MKQHFVIGGLSGSGKSTVAGVLSNWAGYHRGVTFTTRQQRPGEVAGEDYDFFTMEQYHAIKAAKAVAEETVYIGNSTVYGISWERLQEAEQAPGQTLWILDTTGLERLQELLPGRVDGVFLYADKSALTDRMLQRGEATERIERRLAMYDEELALGVEKFPYGLDTSRLAPFDVLEAIVDLLRKEGRHEK
jgi:guanylate kinase